MEPAAEQRGVVILGAGPAGLAAARRLRERGVQDLLVLERETAVGGVPRHCGHSGFGLLEFGRLMSGPAFARRAVEEAAGIEIRTGTTVTALGPGGALSLATPQGPARLQARRVLLATGVRETPRPPRLVSGTRPWGVVTTGALQQLIYLAELRPFRRAVIVGSELVSFSALLTLRSGGIEPLAMIEPQARITARRPLDLLAKTIFGVPILTDTRLVAIEGLRRVEGVVVEHGGEQRRIACDGVVFTGGFQPETAVLRPSHLELDPGSGGPAIDQHWRCSDPAYFACGNLVHPVETAGLCYREGLRAGEAIALDLEGRLPQAQPAIRVEPAGALRYLYPQRIALPASAPAGWRFNARASRELQGRLRLLADGREVWSQRLHVLPERRIRIPGAPLQRLAPERLQAVLDSG